MFRNVALMIIAVATLIVMPIVLFISYSVVGPFFSAMGGETYEVFGGISAGGAINMEGALVLTAFSVLVVPLVLAIWYFMRGGRQEPAARAPRRRRRP